MRILHDVKEESHTWNYKDSSVAYRLVDTYGVTAQDAPVSLGQAIRELRGQLTQVELAARVKTDQGTVSRWEHGNLKPELDDLKAIEEAVGAPHGTIVRRCGYVAELVTVEDALQADPTIPRDQLHLIFAAIEAARKGRR